MRRTEQFRFSSRLLADKFGMRLSSVPTDHPRQLRLSTNRLNWMSALRGSWSNRLSTSNAILLDKDLVVHLTTQRAINKVKKLGFC